MRLESFWAGVHFVQHDRISFLWHQDFKLECSGLGGETPFPMSFENRLLSSLRPPESALQCSLAATERDYAHNDRPPMARRSDLIGGRCLKWQFASAQDAGEEDAFELRDRGGVPPALREKDSSLQGR
jgi:hypothetical protein